MDKNTVLKRLCAVATQVGAEVFKEQRAHDCFCGTNPGVTDANFSFEEEVLDFIETAVQEKQERDSDVQLG